MMQLFPEALEVRFLTLIQVGAFSDELHHIGQHGIIKLAVVLREQAHQLAEFGLGVLPALEKKGRK